MGSGRNVVGMGLTGLACLVGEVLASGFNRIRADPCHQKKTEPQAIQASLGLDRWVRAGGWGPFGKPAALNYCLTHGWFQGVNHLSK
jgi:hypothetical protein